ncbi:MAG: hypothetical protein IH600_02200 [Bacteroidetes bacterium]|nr:hypothetical protein [Bacteroidota bacterium]
MRILSILLFLAFVSHAQAQSQGSWERILHRTEFTLWDVTCADSLHCYAVGDYGVIMFSSDGGESWDQKFSPDQFALRHIHFFDDSTGIIAGFRASCATTTDRGATWIRSPLPVEGNFPGMSAVGNTVWLSGENGVVLKSTDRGTSWVRLETGTDVVFDAISFADERNGWVTSAQRKVLHSRDGGASWTEQKIEAFLPISAVCARSASECWIAGYHGLLMRTMDGGQSWQSIEAYETDYTALAFDSRGSGWAVGRRGAIVKGEENNLRWRLHDLTSARALQGITFLANNKALTVGTDGMLYKQQAVYPAPVAPSDIDIQP